MSLLDDRAVDAALRDLPGWVHREGRLEKEFTFPTFADAMAFLVRVAFEAEAADHHPDIAVHYRRVTLTWWTHTEGGVTAKDIEGARTSERLAARLT